MRLSELLKSVPAARMLSGAAAGDPEVTDISIDSRKVKNGTLFMAMAGRKGAVTVAT